MVNVFEREYRMTFEIIFVTGQLSFTWVSDKNNLH